MSAVDQTITVEIVAPTGSVVVFGPNFLHSLAECERDVAHATITDPVSAQAAALLQARLTTAGTGLETSRTKVKAPFLEACRLIDGAAKPVAERIEKAKAGIKKKQIEYAEVAARAAREAEAKRLADIKRLEQEAAQEKAAKAKPQKFGDFDMEIADEPVQSAAEKLEAAKATVLEREPTPAGITWKVRLVATVVDVNKLPDEFVTRVANEVLLRTRYCVGFKEGMPLPVCAGVEFKIDKQPISTGRGDF